MLSVSAFNDPLTGQKLKLDPATRARLNTPDAAYSASPLALDPDATIDGPKPLVRFHKGILGEGR